MSTRKSATPRTNKATMGVSGYVVVPKTQIANTNGKPPTTKR